MHDWLHRLTLDPLKLRVYLWVLFLTLLSFGGLGVAMAADVTVRWVNPTKAVDGTTLPTTGAGSLASTKVEWGTCNGTAFGTSLGTQTASAPATSSVITGLTPGTYCVRAFAQLVSGAASASSNVASKVIDWPAPQPPTTVTVEVN